MAGISFEQAERYVLNKWLKPTSRLQSNFAPVCVISRNPKRQNPNSQGKSRAQNGEIGLTARLDGVSPYRCVAAKFHW